MSSTYVINEARRKARQYLSSPTDERYLRTVNEFLDRLSTLTPFNLNNLTGYNLLVWTLHCICFQEWSNVFGFKGNSKWGHNNKVIAAPDYKILHAVAKDFNFPNIPPPFVPPPININPTTNNPALPSSSAMQSTDQALASGISMPNPSETPSPVVFDPQLKGTTVSMPLQEETPVDTPVSETVPSSNTSSDDIHTETVEEGAQTSDEPGHQEDVSSSPDNEELSAPSKVVVSTSDWETPSKSEEAVIPSNVTTSIPPNDSQEVLPPSNCESCDNESSAMMSSVEEGHTDQSNQDDMPVILHASSGGPTEDDELHEPIEEQDHSSSTEPGKERDSSQSHISKGDTALDAAIVPSSLESNSPSSVDTSSAPNSEPISSEESTSQAEATVEDTRGKDQEQEDDQVENQDSLPPAMHSSTHIPSDDDAPSRSGDMEGVPSSLSTSDSSSSSSSPPPSSSALPSTSNASPSEPVENPNEGDDSLQESNAEEFDQLATACEERVQKLLDADAEEIEQSIREILKNEQQGELEEWKAEQEEKFRKTEESMRERLKQLEEELDAKHEDFNKSANESKQRERKELMASIREKEENFRKRQRLFEERSDAKYQKLQEEVAKLKELFTKLKGEFEKIQAEGLPPKIQNSPMLACYQKIVKKLYAKFIVAMVIASKEVDPAQTTALSALGFLSNLPTIGPLFSFAQNVLGFMHARNEVNKANSILTWGNDLAEFAKNLAFALCDSFENQILQFREDQFSIFVNSIIQVMASIKETEVPTDEGERINLLLKRLRDHELLSSPSNPPPEKKRRCHIL